jgi:hypothetical protein
MKLALYLMAGAAVAATPTLTTTIQRQSETGYSRLVHGPGEPYIVRPPQRLPTGGPEALAPRNP